MYTENYIREVASRIAKRSVKNMIPYSKIFLVNEANTITNFNHMFIGTVFSATNSSGNVLYYRYSDSVSFTLTATLNVNELININKIEIKAAFTGSVILHGYIVEFE